MGLEELIMGDDVCVVEWADKAAELFPEDSCWIDLDYAAGENCRSLTLNATPAPDAPGKTPGETAGRYGPLIQQLRAAFVLDRDAKSQPDEQVGN